MWTLLNLLLVVISVSAHEETIEEEPVLYYYGIEESERSLAACARRQACGALVRREWRARGLLRLCRCARRHRCRRAHPPDSTVPINNRDYLQFCYPTTDWPQCEAGEPSLTVDTTYDRMIPDELEILHHKNIQLYPPNITLNCQCRQPNYWRLLPSSKGTTVRQYRCSSLPLCRTGEFCGNVNDILFTLYQSCLCPKNHICVHNGGIPQTFIKELLYKGLGWRAYCQRIGEESYEEY